LRIYAASAAHVLAVPLCCCAAAERAKVFKLSFEYLHIYSSKVAIFAEKNSRIA